MLAAISKTAQTQIHMTDFLHCFDISNNQKTFNLSSTRTLSSLLAMQLFTNDNRPNPMHLDIDTLRDCREEDINGMSSPRMYYVFKRSLLNRIGRPLTDSENVEYRKGDVEIAFEEARRELNPNSPSRLSCLYLVDNSESGRLILRSMFLGVFKNPMIIEVDVWNNMELKRFDSTWIDRYFDNPSEEYLSNYWNGVVANEQEPAWEYLLEGSIIMRVADQARDIDAYVERHFPETYAEIQAAREK